MKRSIPGLTLLTAAVLLLSGCSSMLERSYSSTAAHVDYAVMEDDAVLQAESYQGLVNSILYYVNKHSVVGSIRLYHDTGDVEADLKRACQEVMEQDPLAAYAVRELTYHHTRVLTYYEVDVSITYAHTAEEMEAIRPVSGLAALREELERMVVEGQEHAVFLTSYFSGDEDLADQLLLLAWYSQPTLCLNANSSPLERDVTLYPETGDRRIMEVTVHWNSTPAQVAAYGKQLEETAGLLLKAHPSSGAHYTAAELAALVRAAAGPYDAAGADTALATISGASASDMGLILAMEYLCQQAELEVLPVVGEGSSSGPWLIVSTSEGYRHLLPQSLRADSGRGEDAFRLYTDEELSALEDYAWASVLYPACEEGTASRSAIPPG